MMNRHFLSAAVGLALSAGAGFAIAQGASAPRMEKAMQAAQSIRDAQPSATTTPPTTTPAARTAQVAETSVRPTQAAPSPQASIPVAAAPSPKTEAAQAGAEADELSILQRQAAVLKVKAEIAKYQADIKSSESRAMQAATSVTPGQAGEPGVVPSLVVPGNVTKPPIPLPAAKHGKPRLVHIGELTASTRLSSKSTASRFRMQWLALSSAMAGKSSASMRNKSEWVAASKF